jgi:hypothetical protein
MSLFAKNADGSLKYLPVVTKPSTDTPRNPYRSGYGVKIPSSTLALVNGKWQRVYVACFSNAGSAWVQVKGERVLIKEREPETSAELIAVDKDFAGFLLGYQLRLLWSTSGEHKGQEFESLEGFNMSGAMAKQTADDCMAFYLANLADIKEAAARYGASNDPTGFEPAGHDFWLTRVGHGAGYWDGDLPDELGARLTAASKAAGEVWPYIGDDGKVYQ